VGVVHDPTQVATGAAEELAEVPEPLRVNAVVGNVFAPEVNWVVTIVTCQPFCCPGDLSSSASTGPPVASDD
jgi:hypothetical protein